jgi:hypothetical protein
VVTGPFYVEGSKLLLPDAFQFVLARELTRAVRLQNFLTLVVIEASRQSEGMLVSADDATMQEIAHLIGREVREVDPLGQTEKGVLGMVLMDADYEHAMRVINRIVSRIDNYEFPTLLRIAISAASYPTHAIDAESLRQQAMARPIVWRGGNQSSGDPN